MGPYIYMKGYPITIPNHTEITKKTNLSPLGKDRESTGSKIFAEGRNP
jgi:hypothetical protein